MFAKSLEYILADCLRGSDVSPDGLSEIAARFESLRNYGLLPKGRQNRAKHLDSVEIAAGILSLVSLRPAWAGHTATILKNLRPVGGQQVSCWGADTLLTAIETILVDAQALDSLSHISISAAESGTNVNGLASITYTHGKNLRTVWFVSKYATSLLQPCAEPAFDPKTIEADVSHNLIFNARFFSKLRSSIDISMRIGKEPPGDGAEYDAAEAARARLDALGVTSGSCFLQVGVDTQVTWPRTETLVEYDRFRLILMPKTATQTQSVHIDLHRNGLTRDEAMTVINRFLSTLAWCDNQFAILGHSWLGNPVPVAVPKKDLAFATASHWNSRRDIPNDEKARRALALYREGLNAAEASLTSFAVLSFFKVIELGYREGERVKRWIARSFPIVKSEVGPGDTRIQNFLTDCGDATPADYIWDACRLAVAHASIKSPSDADDATEIRRLRIASDVLQLLARRFITEKFAISQDYVAEIPEASCKEEISSDSTRSTGP